MSLHVVILQGPLDKSVEGREKLVANLVERFGLPKETVEKLLAKPPVALKRGLSKPQAEALVSLLTKLGAEVRMAEEKPAQEKKPEPSTDEQSLAFEDAAEEDDSALDTRQEPLQDVAKSATPELKGKDSLGFAQEPIPHKSECTCSDTHEPSSDPLYPLEEPAHAQWQETSRAEALKQRFRDLPMSAKAALVLSLLLLAGYALFGSRGTLHQDELLSSENLDRLLKQQEQILAAQAGVTPTPEKVEYLAWKGKLANEESSVLAGLTTAGKKVVDLRLEVDFPSPPEISDLQFAEGKQGVTWMRRVEADIERDHIISEDSGQDTPVSPFKASGEARAYLETPEGNSRILVSVEVAGSSRDNTTIEGTWKIDGRAVALSGLDASLFQRQGRLRAQKLPPVQQKKRTLKEEKSLVQDDEKAGSRKDKKAKPSKKKTDKKAKKLNLSEDE